MRSFRNIVAAIVSLCSTLTTSTIYQNQNFDEKFKIKLSKSINFDERQEEKQQNNQIELC